MSDDDILAAAVTICALLAQEAIDRIDGDLGPDSATTSGYHAFLTEQRAILQRALAVLPKPPLRHPRRD